MIEFRVETNLVDPSILGNACSKVEAVVATQVLKDTSPFVPALTGSLNQRSHVEGNRVIYAGPYARYLYYGKVMVDSKTGKGPAYIPDVGYRFRRGATLVPTDRNLVFTKAMHGQAQSHWFEASKAINMKKWERIAQKAVDTYGE